MRRVGIQEVERSSLQSSGDVKHNLIVSRIIDSIFDRGLVIPETFHSLGFEGKEYFGMFEIRSRNYSPGQSWVLAVSNVNNKKSHLSISAGCRILASGNSAFSDEVSLTITYNTIDSLGEMIDSTIQKVHSQWNVHDQRIDAMKTYHMGHEEMSGLLIELLQNKLLTSAELEKVFWLYQKPEHEAFSSRTMWSLYNAVMSVKQSLEAPAMISVTTKLSSVFNQAINFKPLTEKHVQPDLI